MELLQLGFCSLGSRCNRPGREGRRKRRGSGRKKIDRVSPGFDRVDRVSPGFDRVDRVPGGPGFPGPIPKRVFASTRTGLRPGSAGPGSTHQAGPGFKTLLFFTLHLMLHEFIYFLVSQMLFLICF
jgi:hypothetical protein